MDESRGCHSGRCDDAFTYLMDHWAYLEEDYRYKAKDQDCKYDEYEVMSSSGIILSTYVCLPPFDPSAMVAAVA